MGSALGCHVTLNEKLLLRFDPHFESKLKFNQIANENVCLAKKGIIIFCTQKSDLNSTVEAA